MIFWVGGGGLVIGLVVGLMIGHFLWAPRWYDSSDGIDHQMNKWKL